MVCVWRLPRLIRPVMQTSHSVSLWQWKQGDCLVTVPRSSHRKLTYLQSPRAVSPVRHILRTAYVSQNLALRFAAYTGTTRTLLATAVQPTAECTARHDAAGSPSQRCDDSRSYVGCGMMEVQLKHPEVCLQIALYLTGSHTAKWPASLQVGTARTSTFSVSFHQRTRTHMARASATTAWHTSRTTACPARCVPLLAPTRGCSQLQRGCRNTTLDDK